MLTKNSLRFDKIKYVYIQFLIFYNHNICYILIFLIYITRLFWSQMFS